MSTTKSSAVATPVSKEALRTILICDSEDDRKVAMECLKILNDQVLVWPIPDHEVIYKYVKSMAVKHKDIPNIGTAKTALPECSNELEMISGLNRMKGSGNLRFSPLDLTEHLRAQHKKAQALAWHEATVEAGKAADADQQGKFLTAAHLHIFGSKAAKKAGSAVPTKDPLWPITMTSKDGKAPAPNRVENTKAMLDFHGITVRYNVMRGQQEITVPGLKTCTDTRENHSLAHVMTLTEKYGLRMGKESLDRHLLCIQDHYNPVVEWMDSVPWDGKQRFYSLILNSLELGWENPTVEDMGCITEIIQKWFISAVHAARVPMDARRGISAQGMLVFTGKQGKGKTRWFEALVPPLTDWFKDGVRLDPDNKDSVGVACGHWISELGELDATFKRADLAALKAFVTQSTDEYRAAYAPRIESHPRRTVFAGTVNEPEYLKDTTGNRRYWTVPIKQVHPELLPLAEVQQFWAEVSVWHAEGEVYWLSPQAEAWLERWNRGFEEVPLIVEAFKAIWQVDLSGKGRISGDAIRESLAQSFGNMRQQDFRAITSFLRGAWDAKQVKVHGEMLWVLRRKGDQAGLQPVPDFDADALDALN